MLPVFVKADSYICVAFSRKCKSNRYQYFLVAGTGWRKQFILMPYISLEKKNVHKNLLHSKSISLRSTAQEQGALMKVNDDIVL